VHGFLVVPVGNAGVVFHLSRVLLSIVIAVTCLVLLRGLIPRAALHLPGALLAALGLAVISVPAIGTDPGGWYFPVVGTDDRFDGALFFIPLIITLLAHVVVVATVSQHRSRVGNALAAMAVLQAASMVLQRFGLDLVGQSLLGATPGLTYGTVGHSGFAVGIMLVGVPWAMHSLEDAVRRRRLWLVVVWTLVLVLVSAGFAVAGNRTSLFALVAGLAAWVAVFRLSRKGLLAVAFGGACILLLVLDGLRTDSGPAQIELSSGSLDVPTASSLGDLTNLRTVRTRLLMWRLAGLGISRDSLAPWLGRGADAYRIVLREHIEPTELFPLYALEANLDAKELLHAERLFDAVTGSPFDRGTVVKFEYVREDGTEATVILPDFIDRAHNGYLDILISYGFLALLALVTLVVLPFLQMRPVCRSTGTRAVWLVASLMVIVYLVPWFISVPTGLPLLVVPLMATRVQSRSA
jgi:O-antigen ligase